MNVKDVIEYNIKAFDAQLNIEVLGGNIAKQEFYKGAVYALNGLLNHPCITEPPTCTKQTECTNKLNGRCYSIPKCYLEQFATYRF